MRTRFTELVDRDVPIQLAAMGGGIGTPLLAYAVAAAGGLGMVGRATLTAPRCWKRSASAGAAVRLASRSGPAS